MFSSADNAENQQNKTTGQSQMMLSGWTMSLTGDARVTDKENAKVYAGLMKPFRSGNKHH